MKNDSDNDGVNLCNDLSISQIKNLYGDIVEMDGTLLAEYCLVSCGSGGAKCAGC